MSLYNDSEDTQSVSPELPVLTSTSFEEQVVDTLITYPLRGDDWAFILPSADIQLKIQQNLKDYPGKLNGNWGDYSLHAIQEAVGHFGDAPDYDLCVRIQEFSAEVGGYDPATAVAGILDAETWTGFLLALEEGNE